MGTLPPTLGSFALEPSRFLIFNAGARLLRAPDLVWPRSRRSVCFAAEAYPPLRSKGVYLYELLYAMTDRKKSLNVAALLDMLLNGTKAVRAITQNLSGWPT